MNTKMYYLIPVFATVFAVALTFSAPLIVAESEPGTAQDGIRDYKDKYGEYAHDKSSYGDKHGEYSDKKHGYSHGDKARMHGMYHGMHKYMTAEGFVGSLEITEDTNKMELKEQVTVTLSEAADGLDVMGGHIGMVTNENGQKYLVWTLMSMQKDGDTMTVTIHVVDAADAENTTTIQKEHTFDKYAKDRMYDDSTRSDATTAS